jgi:hypothetical protein
VAPPATPVCRVARPPDPFAPPDWRYARADGTFGNRFDDPSGRWGVPASARFRAISFASNCAGAFGEVLAGLRPSLATLAALTSGAYGPAPDPPEPSGLAERAWARARRRGTTRLAPTLRFVDLGDPSTWRALRPALAASAVDVGLSDIDLSAVTGPHREFSQLAAHCIHSQRDAAGAPRCAGLRYLSRLHTAWECWAVFDDRLVHMPSYTAEVDTTDSALLEAAAALGLEVELPDGSFLRP